MVNRNPLSSLKLGHARGVVLLAASHAGLAVHEYAAKQVKRAVTGTGNAAKEQVRMMVRFLLPGCRRGRGRRRRRAGGGHLPCPFPRRPGADRGPAAARRGARARDRPAARHPGRRSATTTRSSTSPASAIWSPSRRRTLERLPRVGEAVELHTELQLREDGITLYGFPDRRRPDLVPPAADRAGRRRAGGAVAAGHAAPARARQRHRRRRQGDAGARQRASARGSRRGSWPSSRTASARCRRPAGARLPAAPRWRAPGDALSALLHLGYGRAEAYAALARVQARLGAELAVDALVREGLKELTA